MHVIYLQYTGVILYLNVQAQSRNRIWGCNIQVIQIAADNAEARTMHQSQL